MDRSIHSKYNWGLNSRLYRALYEYYKHLNHSSKTYKTILYHLAHLCFLPRRSIPREMVVLLQSMLLCCYHKDTLRHSREEHLQFSVSQLDLDQFLDFFLKSKNLKDPITSPNTHSTEERTELMALLKSSIAGVSGGTLKGPCRWMRWG